MNESEKQTRATFVKSAVLLPALASVLSAGALAQAPSGTKTQFSYQSTPKNGQQCSQCTFYIAGKTATANGTCKIVQGSISPKGWCKAFSKKS